MGSRGRDRSGDELGDGGRWAGSRAGRARASLCWQGQTRGFQGIQRGSRGAREGAEYCSQVVSPRRRRLFVAREYSRQLVETHTCRWPDIASDWERWWVQGAVTFNRVEEGDSVEEMETGSARQDARSDVLHTDLFDWITAAGELSREARRREKKRSRSTSLQMSADMMDSS